MQLVCLRAKNFQCFGSEAFEITFERVTYALGPNGSGKTAALHALARMFGAEASMRGIRASDFYVSKDGVAARDLWIEANFVIPEASDDKAKHATVAANFPHMRLASANGDMTVRYRLTAELDENDEIDERFEYVVQAAANGMPVKTAAVSRVDRRRLQVHYLPARRDPSSHVSYATGSLLGRLLRAAKWTSEKEAVKTLAEQINSTLGGNKAIKDLTEILESQWSNVHKGAYFSHPNVSFEEGELDLILKRLNVSFDPAHGARRTNATRLSDGQQSMLYVALVLTIHQMGRKLMIDEITSFDISKLRPPVFSLVAIEEPENSLSPHNLGRLLKSLTTFAEGDDAQVVIATHSAGVMRRVDPVQVRYFRLDPMRCTKVTRIKLPDKRTDAFKYVREAVQAFPELYFARLVVLGEGDSEEIVLAKYLEVTGLEEDEAAISVVPLGGRHVNHFWRLLTDLGIPFVTLLDLDLGRFGGGWGRIRYAATQLKAFPLVGQPMAQQQIDNLPAWDSADTVFGGSTGLETIDLLEKMNIFFSTPLDLDLAMMSALPDRYTLSDDAPDESDGDEDPHREKLIKSVLGKSHGDATQYTDEEQALFHRYHRLFKLGSKPVAHIDALAGLEGDALLASMPPTLKRLTQRVEELLVAAPE